MMVSETLDKAIIDAEPVEITNAMVTEAMNAYKAKMGFASEYPNRAAMHAALSAALDTDSNSADK